MKFDVFGKRENPVMVMLTGSFYPGSGLEYIYTKLSNDFYIIVPTYNGHYENSNEFTTREVEAAEIKEYLLENEIFNIKMVYGQSMGTEIGMELIRQLTSNGINVDYVFFDGAPMIRLSKPYKAFMYLKFSTMIKMFRKKTIDEAINMKFLKQFAGDKINSLRPMLEALITVAPYLTKQSIKNEVECCYTFDFPKMSEEMQKNMYFFYGEDEKAYKTCYKFVLRAYPKANYLVKSGHGHMSYSCENTDEYVGWLRDICNAKAITN